MWEFRVSSLGSLLVFWVGLGVVFGVLCERANRRGGARKHPVR
ncbi:hypothetical protein GBA65_21680 (plasmid) [Rubrobacter marinus]|uniref:Uncharacterized protein n=1 Tax=Rubrobacter marinus TaxID=2653852 RepID=A0A6G8Q3Z9_9ACTN|nr:hypothetical protein GBA65_21680 [Rubrobacter marinus]